MSTAQTQESADLSTAELNDLEDEVSLPYTIENVTLMSPGTWNDIKWTGQEIQKGMDRTDFEEDHNNALFLDHEDRDSEQWVGRVENIRMDGDDMVGDLQIVDKETAIKLEFGAKFGISPKVTGRTDGRKMKSFEFDNFSVVVNPAVKTTFLNSELIQKVEKKDQEGESVRIYALSANEEEELAEHEVHEPEFSGTTEGDWDEPAMEDFDTEDLSEIDDHFLVSEGGFPPENFGDLSLPVVEPNGDLNVNALANAKARAGQVEGLPESDVDRVKDIINNLAEENFPESDFENREHEPSEGEMESHKEDEEMEDQNDTTQNQTEDNIRGDSTMSDTQSGEDAESEAETSEQEVNVDEEALAQKVAEILADDGDEEEDAEAESEAEEEEVENEEESEGDDAEAEDEEVENSVEAEDLGFEEFVSEKMEQNPELSYVEAAKEYEEAQKSEAERFKQEVEEEMSSKIDELKSEIQELKTEDEEEATSAQRVTQALGEQRQEAQEEVKELSDDELDKQVMKSWLSNIRGGAR